MFLLQENYGKHKEKKLSHNPWYTKTIFLIAWAK